MISLCLREVPPSASTPSMYICQTPLRLVHVTATKCHTPSFNTMSVALTSLFTRSIRLKQEEFCEYFCGIYYLETVKQQTFTIKPTHSLSGYDVFMFRIEHARTITICNRISMGCFIENPSPSVVCQSKGIAIFQVCIREWGTQVESIVSPHPK